MIKIKVQHQFSVFISILALIAILVISVCIGYFMFMTETDISSKTRSDIYALIGILLFAIVPFIFTSIKNKTEYVSDIIISADYIELIYKKKQKETKRTRILKEDIEVFEAIVNINKINSGKTSYVYCNSIVTIKLKNKNQIQFLQDSSNKLWGSPYKFILDLIKNSIEIPNFKYQIEGNYEFAKKDIENYSIYKKRLPFSEQLKYEYKSQPKIIKIIYLILIFILIGNLCFMGYLSMPAGKLTKEEQAYMKHYNQAYELRTKKNQYQEAINALNKAEEYFSNTAETYLAKAYCYNKLKEYDKAIITAKEGLKYIDSKSIYRKYHNFKFTGKKDIELYSLLGRLYKKTKNYEEMKLCYDYVITHIKYKYTNAYFQRGYAKYYLSDFNSALQDFYKHKEIILQYIQDQAEETPEFKHTNPTYDEKDLINIEKWITACKKYK